MKWWDKCHDLQSVQFSCSVVSDSLWPHGLQHARLPYQSPTPVVCSNSCPLSWRCHPTISYPLSPPSPPLNLSQYQDLFHKSALCIRWPKFWSFSFSINPSDEYSGLISFRTDWFDLFEIQGTNSQESSPTPQFKRSIFQHSAFFTVQLSHPFMTTGKTTALTRWIFAGKVMAHTQSLKECLAQGHAWILLFAK